MQKSTRRSSLKYGDISKKGPIKSYLTILKNNFFIFWDSRYKQFYTHLPDMLIKATNFPNSNEIPRSCSLNLAVKNFFCCWFWSCCCCCWRFSLRLPCRGSEIFLSWPPITRPLEQWPLLMWPPLTPPLGKSLWKIKRKSNCHASHIVFDKGSVNKKWRTFAFG